MNPNDFSRTPIPVAGDIERNWVLVDANGATLGRLAARVASILRGKHKPNYTPHLDTGDHVVVINAQKVRVTGKKLVQKIYYRHSGYWGGLKQRSLAEMLEKHPHRVIELAVSRMLDKGSRKERRLMKCLHVYAGSEHPHAAQKPVPIQVP